MNQLSKKIRDLSPRLYSPTSSLVTVTRSYNTTIKEDKTIHSIFNYYSNDSKFDIDDTNIVYKVQNLTCKPQTFGYSIEQGERVFKDKTYPNCSDIVEGELPEMSIDYLTNTLEMSCKDGSPYYILEPKKHKGRLYQYSEISPLFDKEKYKGPVKLSVQEFALGSCDGSNFNNLIYMPRYNKTAHLQSKEKASKLGLKHKPLIVMLLTIDSFSRRHFYRKLKKTVKFLNNINNNFSVYDFKIHNIFGDNSIENMIPVLSELPFKNSVEAREYDALGNNSMYSYFRSKGFVTLFGLEDCDFYFPNAMGRYPQVDHVVRSLYCAGKEYMNLNTLKEGSQQRCMGPHMSHWYILNYTRAFSKLYNDASQWVYLHINTAHEATGQHAVTLDDDLVDFFTKYLKEFENTHDLAIFLQADHGMRYGNWFQEIEAYQENKLPVFFLIATKELINRMPGAFEILHNNTLRLTSKTDLRPTINFLATAPYTDQGQTPILEKKSHSKLTNLFQESANLNRTCDDLKISPFACSCLVIKEFFGYKKNPELSHLIHEIIKEGVLKINTEILSPVHGQFDACQQVSFKKVLNTYGLILNNKVEELQIKFSINESPAAIFEVFAFVGTDNRNFMLKTDGTRGSVSPFIYRNHKARIRVVGIKRKDKYAGKCEDYTRSLNLKSEFCICKDESLNNNTRKY